MKLVANTTFKFGHFYLSYTHNTNGYKEIIIFKFDGIFSNTVKYKIALHSKMSFGDHHIPNETIFFELTSDEIYHNITLENIINNI
jgi:hypothetical protein